MPKFASKNRKPIALIKKSNDLIESRYKFDIWETRFFLAVLAKIHRDDTGSQEYRIKYNDIIKDFDLKSAQSYGLLREGAKRLLKQTVSVDYEKDGVKRTEEFHLLRKIDYMSADGDPNEDHEYIDVTIEDKIKPFLLQLSRNFTAYDLKNVKKLGVYSVRLYELLKQYESIGKRVIGVDEMKQMFLLNTEYPLFANFYQRIITPALAEINKHSDLKVAKPEKIKEGKKIVALAFSFTKRAKDESAQQHEPVIIKTSVSKSNLSVIEEAEIVDSVETEMEQDKLYLRFEDTVVKNFGVTPSVFLRLVGQHSANEIEQAIRVTRRMRANGQIKTNVSGYFVKALREGYTDEKEEQEKKKNAQAEMEKQLKLAEKEKKERINAKIRELVSKDPNLTQRAIDVLKKISFYKQIIDIKESQLDRVLEVQDYRDDLILMDGVRNQIMLLEQEHFKNI